MKILVLGGDGYLGWPTAMHLSARGHQVVVADNYLRRRLAREEDVEPLWTVPNMHERARRWHKKSGCQIQVFIGDLTDWQFVTRLFTETTPEAIVHYAEQPSAPYSMLRREASMLTLQNNLSTTANVVFAMKDFAPDAHLVKLGTMGEYGTPDIDIEEGWLEVVHRGRKQKFLYPRQAGSLYHTTKIMDTDLLWFYVRMWGLRVTDLMQGPVYGFRSDESEGDEQLLPCFSYDELFGTVLNRFVVQAVAGYPLTVYGKGGQTRGYLNIKDTLQCVRLSAENPPARGELRIFNQFTETFSVNELAARIASVANQLKYEVRVEHLPNPRVEMEEHYYNPTHTGLLDLGLQPQLLSDDVIADMIMQVARHGGSIRADSIFRGARWK